MDSQDVQTPVELTPAPAPAPEQTDNFSAAISYVESLATSKQFVSPANLLEVLNILKDGNN